MTGNLNYTVNLKLHKSNEETIPGGQNSSRTIINPGPARNPLVLQSNGLGHKCTECPRPKRLQDSDTSRHGKMLPGNTSPGECSCYWMKHQVLSSLRRTGYTFDDD
ncbi:hypothetical protein Tco_1136160 [Tanacetum coccineum]